MDKFTKVTGVAAPLMRQPQPMRGIRPEEAYALAIDWKRFRAIADAVGVDVFRRAPVTADLVLMSLEYGKRMHEPLQAHV